MAQVRALIQLCFLLEQDRSLVTFLLQTSSAVPRFLDARSATCSFTSWHSRRLAWEEVDWGIRYVEQGKRKRIVCDFDWEMDDYEDFIDEKVKDEVLPKDEKEKFKAKQARKKSIDGMGPKLTEALENIRFYMFYPIKTRDTPDASK